MTPWNERIVGIIAAAVLAIVGWIVGSLPNSQLTKQIAVLEKQLETTEEQTDAIRDMAIITYNENYKRLLDQFEDINGQGDPHKRLDLLRAFSKGTAIDRQYDHKLTKSLFEEIDRVTKVAEEQVNAIEQAKDQQARESKEQALREAEAARLAATEERLQESLRSADRMFLDERRCVDTRCTRWIIP